MANEISAVRATPAPFGATAGRAFLFSPQAAPEPARTSASGAVRNEHLEQAVSKITEHYRSSGTQLSFRVDPDIGRVVVSVVDEQSGKILRQIPGEEVLRIARALHSSQAALIEELA